MIQFNLKSLLRNSLLLILILNVKGLFAQQDTVVVYEYIYKTDTVWLESQPVRDTIIIEKLQNIEDATLFIDTSANKADLVIFSSGTSATIPIKRIIYNGNQDQSKMKRKGLFTLLLLPFQMMSFGQAEFSINAGSSSMWLEHGVSTISNPMWTGVNIGGEIMFPIKNRNWGISSGLTARYIVPTKDYLQKKDIDKSLPYLEYDFACIQTSVVLDELNTGLFTTPYWQVSIPLKINYRIKHFKPFIGAEYSFTGFLYNIPEDSILNNYQPKNTTFHDISIIVGIDYNIGKHWGTGMKVSNGLIGQHNHFNDNIPPTLGIEEYYFTNLKMELNLIYTF
jgi:hypothetical protein